MRYCSCHSNIKFISSRHRVISSMYVSVCYLYVLVRYSYFLACYSYASVCHSYVLVCSHVCVRMVLVCTPKFPEISCRQFRSIGFSSANFQDYQLNGSHFRKFTEKFNNFQQEISLPCHFSVECFEFQKFNNFRIFEAISQ